MNQALQDLRYACRYFNRHRGMFLAAILSLGLGIGAGTGFFSVVKAVLLDRLPVKDPDQLVLFNWVSEPGVRRGGFSGWMSRTDDGLITCTSFPFPTYQRLRQHNAQLDAIFAFAPLWRLNLQAGPTGQLVNGELVSGNYFPSLGLNPVAGRLIEDGDDRRNSSPVVVFSYRLWRHSFGSNPEVIGQTVRLNDRTFTVIGVAPRDFEGTLQVGTTSDVFVPLTQREAVHPWKKRTSNPDSWWLQIMGRLEPGAARSKASTTLNLRFQQAIEPVIRRDNPQKTGASLRLPRLRLLDGARGRPEVRQHLKPLIASGSLVVGLLLLIACVNTATLLVGQAPARKGEVAVRLSLGAGRLRMVRQLLTESLLLACTAAALGLLVAYWSQGLLIGLLARQAQTKLHLNVNLDWTVLIFAAAIAVLAGTAFGLLPALTTSKVELAASLKESAATLTRSGSLRLLGRSLVATQIALVFLILVSAGLLLETVRNLTFQGPGFNSKNLLVFNVDPSLNGYTPEARLRLYTQLIARLRSIDGVRDVSYSSHRLLSGSVSSMRVQSRGQTTGVVLVNDVGPAFFRSLEIPVLAGRGIREGDVGRPVAVVSEAFADKYLHAANPVGQTLEPVLGNLASLFPELTRPFEIVGVTRNSKYASLRGEAPETIFLAPQSGTSTLTEAAFYVRIAEPAARLVPRIREAVAGVAAGLPIFDVRTYRAQLEQSYTRERQFALLTSVFSLVGLLLAAIGLYGTLSHSVASRKREFGLRGALGASPGRIQALVMKELAVVGVGLLAGLGGVLALGRLLANLLYGVKATDLAVMVTAGLVLLATAVLACYLPARRASKVDPAAVLRFE